MEFIGVDFGGTRLRAALVDSQGRLSGFQERPTDATRPAAQVVEDLASLVRSVEASNGQHGLPVGVGVPTTVSRGSAIFPCPNLPTFAKGFDLAGALEAALGRPVALDNDARCFTRGELLWGQGRGLPSLLGVTLGTSIGLGLSIGGLVYAGARGEAGEIWRAPVRLDQKGSPSLHELLCGEAVALGAGVASGGALEAANRARAGDPRALAAWRTYGEVLGSALAWVVDVVDPERIVLGGSIAAAFDLFRDPLLRALAGRNTEVVVSVLGDRAALLGAAALVRNSRGGHDDAL